MSLYSTLGLSVRLMQPQITVTVGTPNTVIYEPEGGSDLGELAPIIGSYEHTIGTVGGYLAASFGAKMSFSRLEQWLQYGLCAHVRVNDETATRVWEGFVDEIEIRVGGYSLRLGPVMDIANCVRVAYTLQQTAGSTATQQEERFTSRADNTDSQRRFGVLTKFLSGGACPTAVANQLRSAYLAENAWPKGYQTATFGGDASGDLDVTFRCLGYHQRIDVPARWSASGTVNLSAKILTVIGFEQNGLFTNARLDIATNTTQVAAGEQESMTLWELLVGMLPYSDASFRRYTLGVYEDRRVIYAPAPTEIAYVSSFIDGQQRVSTVSGQPLQPWQVLPARWVFFNGLRVGRDISTDLRQDPRAAFIETVKFTAPNKLELSGGQANDLPQMLARYGLRYGT